uniref:hypothetical protein n=1 Tax=Nonomuraea bangladeshensis TaxID=404385 RepID=UPI003F490FAE
MTVKLAGGPANPYVYSLKRDTFGSLQYGVRDGEPAQLPDDYRAHGSGEPEL